MALIRVPWTRAGPQKTVFVLGGGGNLGAIQVGMLRAAIERGVLPDAIVGCSVGAINAAALAADPTPHGVGVLAELWQAEAPAAMAGGRFEAIRLLTGRGLGLHSNEALRDMLERTLPWPTFDQFEVPFHVVATALDDGREMWFSRGEVIAPILASAALPGVFPPVTINGRRFIDGGVVNNVPISKAYQLGATRVVVFHVGNFDRARPVPKRPIDVMIQAFSIARSGRFVVDVASPTPLGVDLVVLPGVDPGRLRYNDFSRSSELVERGYSAAARHLDGLAAAAAR